MRHLLHFLEALPNNASRAAAFVSSDALFPNEILTTCVAEGEHCKHERSAVCWVSADQTTLQGLLPLPDMNHFLVSV